MTKRKNLSKTVANVVFGPTLLAYGWIFLGHAIAGSVLFLSFMAIAYKMDLFEHLNSWPRISQAALLSGLPLIGIGLHFSTQETNYSMLIPGGIYMALSIAGGIALVGKFNG
jgi:hypothetical protein